MSRLIAILALSVSLIGWVDPAKAGNPRVGIYGDIEGLTQHVDVAPLGTGQVYVLGHDYLPFRGYGLGVFADPGVVVTQVTPYWGGPNGCGPNADFENLHCASSPCIDQSNPIRLFRVDFMILQSEASGLTICAGPPSVSILEPPAPHYTPCSPVNSYPAELAASPYGVGCVGLVTSPVATETVNWGSLKHRFE